MQENFGLIFRTLKKDEFDAFWLLFRDFDFFSGLLEPEVLQSGFGGVNLFDWPGEF